MPYVLYVAGLIIGITLFLYILSTYESGKEKYKNFISKKYEPAKPEIDSNDISYKTESPNISPKRTCPLCTTPLQDYEALYASESMTEGRKKILIFGCRYCYRERENDNLEHDEQ